MSTGRSGKIGAVARLLEKCQVPITSELADRCHEGDGDGTLVVTLPPVSGVVVICGESGAIGESGLMGAPMAGGGGAAGVIAAGFDGRGVG